MKNYNYKVFIYGKSKEFLHNLNSPKIKKQLCDTINEISANPYKSKFKHLKNTDGLKRARSGKYRIIFFIKDEIVYIIKISLRKDAYKKMK
ncbi:type II toxin-antitoxin system RelE family toxin [Methanobrevibacter boviskoreani]|uniref:type II toxin-antitoxin system RelE family toxin n=1 Tax=Methanobrevibacter boviskoreani TaxID=1348249 RepID=UPI0030B873F3